MFRRRTSSQSSKSVLANRCASACYEIKDRAVESDFATDRLPKQHSRLDQIGCCQRARRFAAIQSPSVLMLELKGLNVSFGLNPERMERECGALQSPIGSLSRREM